MLTDQKIYDLWNANPECLVNDAGVLQLGRAIEAEVMQSCHSQNAICAPQEDLQSAEVLQAQEPVAWFAFADSNGPVPLELWGFDQKACKYAVLENARSVGWEGTIEGYLFQKGWTIRPLVFADPQPPTLCPNCCGQEPDDLRLRDEYIKAEREIERLQAKLAELEKDQSQYCPDCEGRANGNSVLVPSAELKKLQAKVAELKEKMFGESETFVNFLNIDHPKALGERDRIIAQQAERIAELEETRDALWETQKALCNQINERDNLIEQCEKALNEHHSLEAKREALAAIAANRS